MALLSLIASALLTPTQVPSTQPVFRIADCSVHNWRWPAGLTLGGMGCGKLELGTDGSIGHLTLNNNWDTPIGWLRSAFFAVRAERDGQASARLLRLRSDGEFRNVANVTASRFRGLFPQAWIDWPEPLPQLDLALRAWSPLSVDDPVDASLPIVFFRLTARNTGKQPALVTLLGCWPNLVGLSGGEDDRSGPPADQDADVRNDEHAIGAARGVRFSHAGKAELWSLNHQGAQFWGVGDAGGDGGARLTVLPSWRAGGDDAGWWPGFVRDNVLRDAPPASVPAASASAPAPSERSPADLRPAAAVACTFELAPGAERSITFVLAWYMPHLVMIDETGNRADGVHRLSKGIRAAFDGKPDTRWSTRHAQQPGDTLTLALQQPARVAAIALDGRASPGDWPRGLRIETSENGSDWTPAASLAASLVERMQDANRFTVALPPGPPIRDLRLQVTGAHDRLYWSVHELTLLDAAGTPVAVDLTSSFSELFGKVVDLGHFYQRRFAALDDVVSYAVPRGDVYLNQIQAWQQPVLDSNLPVWLKVKLINDLFPAVSNTVFTRNLCWSVLESPVTMGGALGTMDQRMAAHAGWAMFWPQLDQNELRLFAACQQDDGRISHFCGNVWQALPKADTPYGITDWPDLSASFVGQVLKHYRWSGDRAFLNDMFPHVRRALAFLKSADQDGDEIPEGGSTYDYEMLPRGAFIFNASVYLAALRSAAQLALEMGEPQTAAAWSEQWTRTWAATERLLLAADAVPGQPAAGRRFIKWRDPKGEKRNPNSFIASLAGDWLTHSAAAPPALPPPQSRTELQALLTRHLDDFHPVPPMEVTDDRAPAVRATFILQHQPYLGSEAVYLNHVDAGLEVHRRVFDLIWLKHQHPWSALLGYKAEGGDEWALKHYMTHPASWHLLQALTGLNLDLPGRTLYCSPRLGEELPELHLPVYLGRAWFWVDCVPSHKRLRVRVLRLADDAPFAADAPPERGDNPAPRVVVTRPVANAVIEHIRRDAFDPFNARLDSPLLLKAGAELDLGRWWDALVPPPGPDRPGCGATRWQTAVVRPDGAVIEDAARALCDGLESTRWSTGRPMQPGDAVRIDLGQSRDVESICLAFARWPDDYPRGLRIETADSPAQWTLAVEWAPANPGSTGSSTASVTANRRSPAIQPAAGRLQLTFPARPARWIRLTQTGRDEKLWWSIGEVTLAPAAASATRK